MTREQLLTEVLKGLEDMGFSEKIATLDPHPTETLIVRVSKDGIKVKTEWLPQVKPLTVVAGTYGEWLKKKKAKVGAEKEPEPTFNPQEKNKQDLETVFIISAMKNTSEEEFITKALRKFVPNKGITVYFVGERSQSVLDMEMGFEVAAGDRLSSEYDRLVEYFIPKSGGVVKVLGETGVSESGAESEIITKTIDTRNNLPLNLLTIIKDLK